MEPSLCHVQLWLHAVRASARFSEGPLRLIALGLVARSVGGPTFWKEGENGLGNGVLGHEKDALLERCSITRSLQAH